MESIVDLISNVNSEGDIPVDIDGAFIASGVADNSLLGDGVDLGVLRVVAARVVTISILKANEVRGMSRFLLDLVVVG